MDVHRGHLEKKNIPSVNCKAFVLAGETKEEMSSDSQEEAGIKMISGLSAEDP